MDFFIAGGRENFQSVRQAESCGINDKRWVEGRGLLSNQILTFFLPLYRKLSSFLK